MKLKLAIVLSIAFLGMISCYKTPEYPIEPSVAFDTFEMRGNVYTLEDTGNLLLTFTDGDGDLGKLNNQDSSSLVLYRNLRDTSFFKDGIYIIPQIPKKGTTNAIDGTIAIKLSSLSSGYQLYFASKGISVDTFTYKISITDRAGHQSNVIITPPIVMKMP